MRFDLMTMGTTLRDAADLAQNAAAAQRVSRWIP